jgi:hypothetical protein
LTLVELNGLLARRRRGRDINSEIEKRALADFEDDVRQGFS